MDMEYLLLLQELRNAGPAFLEKLFASFSDATGRICFGVLFFLYWSYKKESGLYGLMSLTLARYINSFVKLCACVYRPWIRNPRIVPPVSSKVHATGYSFPSGHSTTCAGGFGMLGWLFRKKIIIPILCATMILLTMFSRNLLGVHTPQDVIVGCMTGFLAVFLVCRIMHWESTGRRRDLIILSCLVLLDIALLLFYTFKNYPIDYDAAGKLLVDPAKMQKDGWKDLGSFTGIILGWIIEKRFVKFTIPADWKIRIARFIPGFAFFRIADGLFPGWGIRDLFATFLGATWGALVGDIILYAFCIAIYPMLFMWIEQVFMKQCTDVSR